MYILSMKNIFYSSLLLTLLSLLSAEPVFNGKDLTGWQGGGHIVKDGTIIYTSEKKEGGSYLYTEKEYENYIFDFEFKLPPAGNSGIGIHFGGRGDVAYTGMEIQILDNSHPRYKKLEDFQYNGSIYKLQAAERGHLKPVGEWNKQTIIVNGPHVFIILNGVLITRGNLDELEANNPKHQGVKRRKGFICLAGHGSPVAFRNLSVEELPATPNQ